jgi:hypothetical protein
MQNWSFAVEYDHFFLGERDFVARWSIDGHLLDYLEGKRRELRVCT